MNINPPKITDIPKLRMLWQEVFGDSDEFLDAFFKTAFSPERAMAVYVNDKIVSMLYWFNCECWGKPMAYIYAVGTDIAYRGRGICRKLMECTHQKLLRDGYSGAILVPGENSLFEFYGKMGYKTATYVDKFTCGPSDVGVEITPIKAEEYEMLRREYLPYGGAVQERENTQFLAREMQLYKGDDFIVAVTKAGGKVYCSELLGNIEKASGIVAALGADAGYFRTPDGNTPFAMYISLDKVTKPPTYLGLAFD